MIVRSLRLTIAANECLGEFAAQGPRGELAMLDALYDPFAVDPVEEKAAERRRLLKVLATLLKEVDRLEARVDVLYRAQSRLPDNDHWDDVFNDYDFRINRLIARSDAMSLAAWKVEEEVYWKF